MPAAFSLGQVVATPLIFAIAGFILLGFVLGYGGLARRIRHPGGLYVQVASGLGRPMGLGAAALLFVSYLGLVATIYGLTAVLLKGLLDSVLRIDVPPALTALTTVSLVLGLSFAPLRLLARVLLVVVSAQTVTVLWLAFAALNSQPSGKVSVEALDPSWLLSGSFIVALIFAFTGFVGSEGATAYSDDLADPFKSVPRATYISYAVTTTLLVLGSWAVSGLVGAETAATPNGTNLAVIVAELTGLGSGSIVEHLLVAGVFVGLITSGVALNNGAARQLAGLAHDGVLPSFFVASGTASMAPTTQALMVQPVVAGFIGVIVTLFTGAGLPLWFSIASGLGVLGVLALSSVAAAVWFMRGEADESGFLGWEGQVVAGLFSALAIGTVFGYGVTHVQQVAPESPPVAGWVVGPVLALTFASGFVAAHILRARRPAVYTAIGGPRVDDERRFPRL